MKRKQAVEDFPNVDNPAHLVQMATDGQVDCGIEVAPGLTVSPLVIAAFHNNEYAASLLIGHGATLFYRQVSSLWTIGARSSSYDLQPFALAHLDTLKSQLVHKKARELSCVMSLSYELLLLIFEFAADKTFRDEYFNSRNMYFNQ